MKQKYDETTDRETTTDMRQREGAFFTPTQWVDEAHRMIEKELGENWKEEYVVWDCCSGTGNLTRDYEFKELYCSTLIEEELDILKGNCIKFQHDFLNLDEDYLNELKGVNSLFNFIGDSKKKIIIPEKLTTAFEENKKIVFLMNPPYGTAGNMNTKADDHKSGIAKTSIGTHMKDKNMGAASQQLYAQFLYEIMMYKEKYKLDNVIIATFTKPLFLTGGAFKKFRGKFLNEFEYKSGMLFQASHFSDVSKNWGISFTIWKNGVSENKSEFNLDLKDIVGDKVEKIGEKIVYNLDGKVKASQWVREEIKGMKTHKDCVQMKSGLNPNLIKSKGSDIKGSIGYIQNQGNNVTENAQKIALYSKPYSNSGGLPVLPINYKKCVALFTARKSIKGDWKNDKDEYSKPEINLKGSDIKGSIGYMHNHANDVGHNSRFVGLYSSVFSAGAGLQILPINYKKCVALFTARKCIKGNWINDKDEYSAPNRGSDIKGSIGYFQNNSNNVYKNLQYVSLHSSVFVNANGLPILPINYKKCVALFTARKCIKNNWKNNADEYSAPVVDDVYEDWNNDCIVYSLFNTSSQQSAMRGIEFNNKVWDIKNEWFWMSKDDMLRLGEKYKFDGVQLYLKHSDERFIYKELKGIKLSEDAQKVLNRACELVEKSFEYRERMHEEHPEYHLQCWDSGWYQIKKILNVYMKDELKEFNIMYKEFEGRMRDGAFDYGFLKSE